MRPFTIYFPAFYPTPTNDAAWGKGFTDWMLVAHANLHERWLRRAPQRGFYDGSDPAVHDAQMNEMLAAGLGGMAIYHYWFYSHQELPAFERTLLGKAAGRNVPWFLVWASEGWSRRWLGDPGVIATLSTSPSPREIQEHCRHLARCFEHPAYFRWRGKPLFVWYHLDHFDDPEAIVDAYRQCMREIGCEMATGHFIKNPFDARHSRFVDVSYLFEPRLYFGMRRKGRGRSSKVAFDRVRAALGETAAQRLVMLVDRVQQKGQTFPARDHLAYLDGDERARFVRALPGVVQDVVSPGWNNTPRYALRYTALEDLAVADFQRVLHRALAKADAPPPLINAWNEWSEGAAIEPCAYFGSRYLDALDVARQQLVATQHAEISQ